MIVISKEVKNAIESNLAVVALESAVITHGLNYPINLECALNLEKTVRKHGAVPATICIIDGKILIGTEESALKNLANRSVTIKISERHIGAAAAQMLTGGTTVSATIALAYLAGIKVMATGGIGGVHRGDGSDISSDLPTLAKTSIMVVCAGAKAILNLRATREWLETHSIPVIGYKTKDFPAFYSTESGEQNDFSFDNFFDAAEMFRAHTELGRSSSMLVVNPPPESLALPFIAVESAIKQAIEEMELQNITGSSVTPFLLKRVGELTGGESVKTNLALLESNAALAAQIAVEVSKV